MASDPSDQPIKMALVTVGTRTGSLVLYSRSKRSIHQHAMRVSLRRAEKHGSAIDDHSEQARAEPRPRAELMNRFRARASPTNAQLQKATKKPKVEPTPKGLQRNGAVLRLRPEVSFNKPNPTQNLPFETGLEADYLSRLLDHLPHDDVYLLVDPDGPFAQYALHDYALRNGILALASLGRDLDHELRATRLCLEFKGRTIQAVRQRLLANPDDISVGTIGPIASLAAFDLLECLGTLEPRADSMSFLHLAVSRKGGLHGLGKEIAGTCEQCSMLRRIILWLDFSYAILEETTTRFSRFNSPIHLYALNTVSIYMTPLRLVFAELSDLSLLADSVGHSVAAEDRHAYRNSVGDRTSAMEQYITSLGPNEIPSALLETLRLATFLYSARYIRQFTSRSRIQMQLAVRLETCLDNYVNKRDEDTLQSGPGFENHESHQDSASRAIIIWAATVAAASCCSFEEISGHAQKHGRKIFWTNLIICILHDANVGTISEVESILDTLIHDTQACRSDRRLLLMACGVLEA